MLSTLDLSVSNIVINIMDYLEILFSTLAMENPKNKKKSKLLLNHVCTLVSLREV